MIRQITADTFSDIEGFIDAFVEKRSSTNSPVAENFKEKVMDRLSSGDLEIVAKFEASQPSGFAIYDVEPPRISLIHTEEIQDNPEKTKRDLFDEAFHRLSKKGVIVRTGGSGIDMNLSDHIIGLGFKRFDRKTMLLTRASIESIPEPTFSKDFNVDSYHSHMKDEVSQLIYRTYIDHLEVDAFPEFFGSEQGALDLIENIEEFKHDPYSKVLTKENEFVGVCFIISKTEYTGHVALICIERAFQKKGLGRDLFVYSLKEMLKEVPSVERITLDVTVDNPARKLYESLGFNDCGEFTIFTWAK